MFATNLSVVKFVCFMTIWFSMAYCSQKSDNSTNVSCIGFDRGNTTPRPTRCSPNIRHCFMMFTLINSSNKDVTDQIDSDLIVQTQGHCFSDSWTSNEVSRWCPNVTGVCLVDLRLNAREYMCCCKGNLCNSNPASLKFLPKKPDPTTSSSAALATTTASISNSNSEEYLIKIGFIGLLIVVLVGSFLLVMCYLIRFRQASFYRICCPKSSQDNIMHALPSEPQEAFHPLWSQDNGLRSTSSTREPGMPTAEHITTTNNNWSLRSSMWLQNHHLSFFNSIFNACCWKRASSGAEQSQMPSSPLLSHSRHHHLSPITTDGEYLLLSSPNSVLLSDVLTCASQLHHSSVGVSLLPSSVMGAASPPPTLPFICDKISIKAEGRFGAVWRAILRPSAQEVALKIFSSNSESSWRTEVSIYELLTRADGACKEINAITAKVSSNNILQFLGAEKVSSLEYWLLTEYHPLGSVHDYLKAGHWLTWDELLQVIQGIANGLAYLHEDLWIRSSTVAAATTVIGGSGSSHADGNALAMSGLMKKSNADSTKSIHKPSIAHRDLKSKNILLRRDLQPCIGDMELALQFNSSSSFLSEAHIQVMVGTKRYMSPEVLDGAIQFTRQAFLHIDVYALALIMWECMICCRCCNEAENHYKLEVMHDQSTSPVMPACVSDPDAGKDMDLQQQPNYYQSPPPIIVLSKSSQSGGGCSPRTVNVGQLLGRMEDAPVLVVPTTAPEILPSLNVPLSPATLQSINDAKVDDALGKMNFYRLPFDRELYGQPPSMELMRECVVDRRCRPLPFRHWKTHHSFSALWKTVCECWDPDAEARLNAGCVAQRISYLIHRKNNQETSLC